MTSSLKVKMDGQIHELDNFEVDNNARSIYLDLDNTFSVQIEDLNKLFDKDVEIKRVGHDDDFIKAKINSYFVESTNKENQVLGLSY